MSGATETVEIAGADGGPVTVTLRRRGVREILRCVGRAGEINRMEGEPARFDGNSLARRKAAAQARKGIVVMPLVLCPVDPSAQRVARGRAEVKQA